MIDPDLARNPPVGVDIRKRKDAQPADFYECGPMLNLLVCPVGWIPDCADCEQVGTGKTTLEYAGCCRKPE